MWNRSTRSDIAEMFADLSDPEMDTGVERIYKYEGLVLRRNDGTAWGRSPEYMKAYFRTPEGKEARRRYNASPQGKASRKAYRQSEAGKACKAASRTRRHAKKKARRAALREAARGEAMVVAGREAYRLGVAERAGDADRVHSA